MERQQDQPATPRDATRATEEQRELQDQLDHDEGDPEAPGLHQDRHQIADET
jgi:cell division protein FtsN